MKRYIKHAIAMVLLIVPVTLLAATQGYWSVPSAISAGTYVDFYIYGGNSVAYDSQFEIKLNGQTFCATDWGSSTPIRHCGGTISSPGTYTLSAQLIRGDFLPPQPVFINVSP